MSRSPLLRRLFQLTAVAATIVLVFKVTVYGWQRQLTHRLQRSVTDEDHAACVASGEQLARLRPLKLAEAGQLAHCRRVLASNYWAAGEHQKALDLLERLVASSQVVGADQLQLFEWVRQRRDRAVEHYRRGELSTAVALLQGLSDGQEPQRHTLIESLQVRWNLNRQLYEQANRLRTEERWWEAFNTINQLDHPWWHAHAQPLHDEIAIATQALSGQGMGRDGHNGRVHHNVPLADLDRRVRINLTRSMDYWHAYSQACHELGGMVVDYGPESVCRR